MAAGIKVKQLEKALANLNEVVNSLVAENHDLRNRLAIALEKTSSSTTSAEGHIKI